MRRERRSMLLAFFTVLTSTTLLAQSGYWNRASDIRLGVHGGMIGTVTDVDEPRRRVTIVPDADPDARVVVTTDTLATQYRGFGEEREVYAGAAAFTHLRVGDRIEVRGAGGANQSIAAEDVYLLGRSVEAPRPRETDQPGTLTGTVRSVTTRDSRVVIETDARTMHTIFGSASTPVYYQGQVYRIRNIEVGDRVRVDVESATRDGVRARRIDVLASVSRPDEAAAGNRMVTSIVGRVTRADARALTLRVATDRGREIRVDAQRATDRNGRRFRVSDVQSGDVLEISGQFLGTDTFRADTIRFTGERQIEIPVERDDDDDEEDEEEDGEEEDAEERDDEDEEEFRRDRDDGFTRVVFYGTIRRSLERSSTLVIRDSATDRDVSLFVDDEFFVRTRDGANTTASQLRVGDSVAVKAFRDEEDRLIAQTIRLR